MLGHIWVASGTLGQMLMVTGTHAGMHFTGQSLPAVPMTLMSGVQPASDWQKKS